MTAQPARFRFHNDRDRLLAEVHARPSTPLSAPALATRIVSLSGEAGIDGDRTHMTNLCRKLGQPAPASGARWHLVDAGSWRLRWERHTEVSAWTFLRPGVEPDIASFGITALDAVPRDWLEALPGEVLAAAHAAVVGRPPEQLPFAPGDIVAARIGKYPMWIYTDFRPGADDFTRFILAADEADAVLVGRTLQQLLEVETYRLLALLALPTALEASDRLKKLEEEVDRAADYVVNEGGVESDRDLLRRLSALAGEAEALAGRTNFRFSGARAYYGIVSERIAGWREVSVEGRPTLGEFMERRLAPAMRTCAAVSDRQRAVLERIARTVQILNTRVEVASEMVNVNLLASMDRRSKMQLRLQQTVEGLSIMAISYYALAVLKLVFDGLAHLAPALDATVMTAVLAPVVVALVWAMLQRARAGIADDRDGR